MLLEKEKAAAEMNVRTEVTQKSQACCWKIKAAGQRLNTHQTNAYVIIKTSWSPARCCRII
jgi:hypothetical protein